MLMVIDVVSSGGGGIRGGVGGKKAFNKPEKSLTLEGKFSKPEMVPLEDPDNYVYQVLGGDAHDK